MAREQSATGNPATAERIDVLSPGRPVPAALPSFEAFYLGEIAGLVT